jgi:hypothetical protein
LEQHFIDLETHFLNCERQQTKSFGRTTVRTKVVTKTIRSHTVVFFAAESDGELSKGMKIMLPARNADPTMLAPSSGDLRQERPHEVIERAGFAVEKARAAGKVANACYLGRIAVLARV